MNYLHGGHNNLRLVSRNEGKIKSYESCTDVRAWSHDIKQRDCFLREWIKSDMQISVIPVNTLVRILRTMTGQSRLRVMPKCQPDCKSKVILESICTSCHVMKECLKNDTDFDKYFAEEEFETCNWPCERCLEVLKSIKMFWKIILEKVFNINISKCQDLETDQSVRAGSIKSVAKIWEKEMVQQGLFVKNITPDIRQKSKIDTKCVCYNHKNINERKSVSQNACQVNKSNRIRSRTTKGTNTLSLCSCRYRHSDNILRNKVSKCTLVKVKTENVACDTCNLEKHNDEIKAYKDNVEHLQEKLISQQNEIECMKKENKSLKLELENFYKSFTVKSTSYAPVKSPANDKSLTVLPKPFENYIDSCKTADKVENIESEMIITLKNCKNKEYKYVSLLKVLHKTNVPDNDDAMGPCYTQENPMDILTKVQNTFGALVKREMGLASKTNSSKRLDISATFHKVNASRSAPSCCTIASDFSCGSNMGSL